jgi:tetratricopeptide (TPR) repeat protein
MRGDSVTAIKYYQEALSLSRQIGDQRYETIWISSQGSAYYTMGRLREAFDQIQDALVIARKIENRFEISYILQTLGRVLLALGRVAEARECLQEAVDLQVPNHQFRAAVALGIALRREGKICDAQTSFVRATMMCRARLEKTEALYEPRYALATALAGRATCTSNWANDTKRPKLLGSALAEYRRALDNCSAKGVVQDAIRDLELIRAAGIEGLEPVFELLESALEDEAG